MRIVDQFGRPFDTDNIKDMQTARVAALEHRMIDSQLDGITPARAAAVLRDADAGNLLAQSQLFDDMLDRDAHLRAEMGKRAGAVLGLDWRIEPPPQATPAETAASERVESILRDAVDDLEDLILAMMEGVSHGFAGIELEWQRTMGGWIPKFHPRPQTWFTLDQSRRTLLLDNGGGGAPLIPMGWVMHQHAKAKTGYIGRMGLGRVLIWPFLYKAYSVGDFAEFLDVYGLPIIVGKYNAAAGEDGKRSLMRAVASLGRDARAVMPDDMQIEVQKITASGDGSPHLAMMEWAERAMSKAILGQTTSADAQATGMGSGVANLHADVRHDILAADARQIAGTLTRDLVYPLIVLNGGGVDSYWRCPRWVFDLSDDAADLATLSDGLEKLVGLGLEVPVDWVHSRLNIPKGGKGAKMLRPAIAATPTAPAMSPAALRSAHLAAHVTGCQCNGCLGVAALKASPPSDDPQDQIDRSDPADQHDQAQALIKPLLAALKDGMSPEQALDAVASAYPAMDTHPLIEALARAMFATELMGQWEAQNE